VFITDRTNNLTNHPNPTVPTLPILQANGPSRQSLKT